ncbi:MAG: antibiotic biosynthesis monooxygenase [Nevskia sp.]
MHLPIPFALPAMSNPALVQTPKPPYYAVIFSSLRRSGDDGYGAMADHMEALAAEQPGYLGIESVRGADGCGITISYWTDEAAILAWRRNAEHALARAAGRARWYSDFQVRVAKVERAYGMAAAPIA